MPDIGRLVSQRFSLSSQTNVTTGGTDTPMWVGSLDELLIFLDVTNVSGTTPSLTVFIDAAMDGQPAPGGPSSAMPTEWSQIAAFSAQNVKSGKALATNDLASANLTVGRYAGASAFGNYVRVRWTITGTTPSFSFNVVAIGK